MKKDKNANFRDKKSQISVKKDTKLCDGVVLEIYMDHKFQ